MLHFILFGPPGAGKGTQSKILSTKHHLIHLSTGDMLRKHLQEQSVLGKEAAHWISKGLLVPDRMVNQMIIQQIEDNPNVKGFIYDGFPRTTTQAIEFDKLLHEREEEINLMIALILPDSLIRERMLKRAEIEGRIDDLNNKVIATRIATYHEKTKPLIDYFSAQNKCVFVDGAPDIDEVSLGINTLIDPLIQT